MLYAALLSIEHRKKVTSNYIYLYKRMEVVKLAREVSKTHYDNVVLSSPFAL
jgi:hypothetical protein